MVWRLESSLQESVLSFYYVSLGNWIQMTELDISTFLDRVSREMVTFIREESPIKYYTEHSTTGSKRWGRGAVLRPSAGQDPDQMLQEKQR